MLYLISTGENAKTTRENTYLQKLVYRKQKLKKYFKYYPNTYNYIRILTAISEINSYKHTISRKQR